MPAPSLALPDADRDVAALARWAWMRGEAVHALAYFHPEVATGFEQAGLEAWMARYVATRAAPMGAVGPEVVTAVFHGFSPRLVASVVPAVWGVVPPARAVTLTLATMGRVLDGALAPVRPAVVAVTPLLRRVAEALPSAGRPLGAAWSGVAWTGDEVVDLWLAATRIRESRGDGHVACLVAAGLDGIEAQVTVRGDGASLRATLADRRGHAAEEVEAAVERLRARGLIAPDGAPTPAGEGLRAAIEAGTDALVAPGWAALAADERAVLRRALDLLWPPLVALGVLPGIVTRRLPDPDPSG